MNMNLKMLAFVLILSSVGFCAGCYVPVRDESSGSSMVSVVNNVTLEPVVNVTNGTVNGSISDNGLLDNNNSSVALFDVNTVILTPNVQAGETLSVSVNLLNFGNKSTINVTVNYEVRDFNDKIILITSEIIPVDIQFQLIKDFIIPKSAESGKYRLITSIVYAGQKDEAVAHGYFNVSGVNVNTGLLAAFGALEIVILGGSLFMLGREFGGRPLIPVPMVEAEVLS